MLAKEEEPAPPPTRPEAIKSVTVPKYRIKGNTVEYVVNCQNEKSMWQVFRRYQSFKKLQSDLASLCSFGNPYHCKQGVLPVLCGSHFFEATNQSPELVEQRRRYLEVYLQQLLVPSNSFYPEVDALRGFLLDDMMPVYFRSKTTKLVPGLSMCMDGETATNWTLDDIDEESGSPPMDAANQQIAFTPNQDAPSTAVHPSIPDMASGVGSKTHGDVANDRTPEVSFRNDSVEQAMLKEQCTLCDHISILDYPKEEWEDTGICAACGQLARHRLIENTRQSKDLGTRPADLMDAPTDTNTSLDNSSGPTAGQSPLAEQPSQGAMELPARDLGGASIQDFELVTTLGRGTFGKVMKVIHRPSGQVMAMKVLTKSVVAQRRMVEYIREERDIMAMLPLHPFVVTMHYALQTDHHLFFLLDYLPGGELYSHIHPRSHVTEEVARFYIAEVVLAIEHIHHHDVCHRDLKPENVVIARDGHIALTDFGLARARFSRIRRKSFVGSAEYLSPETVKNEYQTKALDWWSVGVMLYEMLIGKTPFHGATNTEVYHNVVHKPLDLNSKRGLSPEAANLISRFLDRNPATRLAKPDEIKRHPFFRTTDWEAVLRKEVTPPFIPDLACNDTKYFAREFTSEWACVQKSSATDPAVIKQWREKFDNFAISRDGHSSGPTTSGVLSVAREPVVVEPQRFIGAWRLLRLELQSHKGQITYPWGAEVVGLLNYTAAGYFSMQLAPIKRVKIKRHSTEDMAQAFVGFVAQFGSFHLKAGWNFIVHAPSSALNPNMSMTRQKRYFKFSEGSSGADVLSLITDEFIAEDQERLHVRTVTVWERVMSRRVV